MGILGSGLSARLESGVDEPTNGGKNEEDKDDNKWPVLDVSLSWRSRSWRIWTWGLTIHHLLNQHVLGVTVTSNSQIVVGEIEVIMVLWNEHIEIV